MQTLNPNLLHLVGDGTVSSSRETVNACAQQEVDIGIAGGTEQLVDVAFQVADVHDALRFAKQRCAPPQAVRNRW